jgi:hypothetical protein
MANKILIRLIGTLTCFAAVATAWDAEAARCHRHHRRCCYTAPCCAPVCAPVCDPCCAPVCATVCAPVCDPCCSTTVVRREVIVPSCCQASSATGGVVIAEQTKESAVKLTATKTAAATR